LPEEQIKTTLDLENKEFVEAKKKAKEGTDSFVTAAKKQVVALQDLLDKAPETQAAVIALGTSIWDLSQQAEVDGPAIFSLADNVLKLGAALIPLPQVQMGIGVLQQGVTLLKDNWGTIKSTWDSIMNTPPPVEPINKVTEAIKKQKELEKNESHHVTQSERQKAGHEFHEAQFRQAAPGVEREDMEQDILEQYINTLKEHGATDEEANAKILEMQQEMQAGIGGDKNARHWLMDRIASTSGGASNNALRSYWMHLAGIGAGARKAANSDMLNAAGDENEEDWKNQIGRDFCADQAQAARDKQQDESHVSKAVDTCTEGVSGIVGGFNDKMDKLEEKIARTQKEMAAGRQVQDESMQMYGQQSPLAQAMQIAKQREAAMKGLQMDTLNTILGTQQDFAAEMQMQRQFNAQARKINTNNKTFQNMGDSG